MTTVSVFLFVCAGLLPGAVAPNAGGDQGARDGGWVLVRKPPLDPVPSGRVFLESATRDQGAADGGRVLVLKPLYYLGPRHEGYIKRSVGLPGGSLGVYPGVVARTPGIIVERITVEGGRVEITGESIVIEGGRVEIIRRPGQ